MELSYHEGRIKRKTTIIRACKRERDYIRVCIVTIVNVFVYNILNNLLIVLADHRFDGMRLG